MVNDLEEFKGEVFWSLPTWITYVAGSELGCTIFVANPTDTSKEYCLMAKLISTGGEVILEESIPVHDYAWFSVDPNDFIRLFGSLKFDISNVTLVVELIERESDEVVDTVSTYLVMAQWPWAGAPTLPGGIDWTSLMMVIMIGVMGIIVVKGISEKEEKKKEEIPYEERVALSI